ncbi:bifunctional ADP-dependent NAD(P)H-hydrate dehydratase/NAD(P)H-hydrate epimerase [Salinicoccus luteus]|uniref:bifunctional ADP-dependent NAD(P)H-hydrate dehydratase/NAD(P)H-hydrate epimerase n=1 Tax=Salinicoccus luteus TaxID=367840 RepID=UPI0004E1C778|nr:bifunctional ADP-dependent NAD(P)H-hydrate dehydratase/NAD(P)H-hydrate epimerase [Salinicoccus luteus]
MKIVKRDEMRAIEQFAIEEIGISSAVLMEIAGNQVAEALMRSYPDQSVPITILIGSGNNGGDGFVIARRLFDAGYAPSVWLLVDPGKLQGDARVQHRIHTARQLPLHSIEEGLARLDVDLASSEAVVDAMLGTGISGAVREPFNHIIEMVNGHEAHVVAVDLPSGLDCDTGRVENVAIRADATFTFALPKLGFYLQDGPSVIGRLEVKDISVPETLADTLGMDLPELITEELAAQALPGRAKFGHKGTFGHVLVIGGSRPFVGAPLYSAHAAYNAGAGLVTLAIPEEIYPVVAGQNQLALIRTLPSADGHFNGDGLEADLFEKVSAVAIGPGLGRFDAGEGFIEEIMEHLDGQPIIIDADGLYHVKDRLEMLSRYDGPVILTPHPGEMANLTGRTVAEVESDRINVAVDFARKHQVHLVLKGHRTIIATPEGIRVNPHGNDALAKGGSGDVLTGMIASFLAQGAGAAEAMQAAVYVHAASGERAAQKCSHYGVTPGDIIETGKEILKELEGKK